MALQDFLVRYGDLIIGRVPLHDWDRGMGVAGGVFLPNEQYVPQLHATEVGGIQQHGSDRSLLAIVGVDGIQPSFEAVYLADWSAEAGPDELELTVFGIDIIGVFGPNNSDEE